MPEIILENMPKIKRERGDVRPAQSPVSPIVGVLSRYDGSGGQNLAALSTTAGENLAAVGSSHSLAETMHLGTVTTAGLVGTLHELHLLSKHHSYARQPKLAAATHNN